MATHLINRLPSKSIDNHTPYFKLHNTHLTYDHLRTFGCLCYPHVHAPHKIAPRSTPCIFLGYPDYHRGYHCFDFHTKKIIIFRHVIFDEQTFPYASLTPNNPPSYIFLDTGDEPTPITTLTLNSFNPPDPMTPPSSPPPVSPIITPDPRHHLRCHPLPLLTPTTHLPPRLSAFTALNPACPAPPAALQAAPTPHPPRYTLNPLIR